MLAAFLNHLDYNDTAWQFKLGLGIGLLGISIRWLRYPLALAGVELILWALVAPGIFWPWLAIGTAILVVIGMILDYLHPQDDNDDLAVDVHGTDYHEVDAITLGYRRAFRARGGRVQRIRPYVERHPSREGWFQRFFRFFRFFRS